MLHLPFTHSGVINWEELSIHLSEKKRKEKAAQPKAWTTYILHYQYRRKQYKYPELVEVYKLLFY